MAQQSRLLTETAGRAPIHLLEFSNNNASPAVKWYFGGTAKKALILGALVVGAFCVLLASPFAARASFFSFFSGLFVEHRSAADTAASKLNSQTVALLEPAVNIDPNPSKGGGDIAILDGAALYAEGSSAGEGDIVRPSSSEISVHIVRNGETLSEIAELYNVSVNTIAWANDIQGRVIHPGQELIILPITGVQHVVTKGETLASIAKKYKGDLDEIANYNELATDAALTVGEIVIVPDGVVAPPPASSGSSAPLRGTSGPSVAGYFLWPVAGGVKTQGLHGYNGVDIGASAGTPIYAAANGTVIVARQGGWNGGYGSYVVVQHNNGTQTLYAHANAVLVSQGEQVAQGQQIATVGATGRATGNHVHFEVRGAKNPF